MGALGWLAASIALLALSPEAHAGNEVVNGYRFPDSPIYKTKGYDWWWHILIVVSRVDGSLRRFFFEYYIINPGLGKAQPMLGNNGANKPSYALTAGTWGDDTKKINNFTPFPSAQNNMANDTYLMGSVSLSAVDAVAHPEFFSDAVSISWSLKADKFLTFDPGFGVSELPRDLAILQMFWHQQLLSQIFDVVPDKSYGYQDKNWGTDYANPWIWLNRETAIVDLIWSNSTLPDQQTHLPQNRQRAYQILPRLRRRATRACRDLTRAASARRPVVRGTLYEYNFSKFNAVVVPKVTVSETEIFWSLIGVNVNSQIVINFSAPKKTMLKIKYESPDNEKIKHQNLWNTGLAKGTVELYKGNLFGYTLIDTLDGELGGARTASTEKWTLTWAANVEFVARTDYAVEVFLRYSVDLSCSRRRAPFIM
ncbi:hypothetical protein M427DRAFT_43052 [Gonapodya prolifera JEL478]|uniref:Uncharacterized protein n=1 Tax=Gonapodya prolifera (strain JEL478) TaxID=1344416 RepID=A0A139ALI2_GONPJ|nr:hypothetical protein M427DRAFT_43052 [Gonapodya prolifera JEL478]|eukprot:KXS17363.1 hypothetical protein M427DRAFT_43052 [Gonapodya prolifera JEL478]